MKKNLLVLNNELIALKNTIDIMVQKISMDISALHKSITDSVKPSKPMDKLELKRNED